MSDDLDWGDAAEYIAGQRPGLDEEHIWAVLKELGDPPSRDQEGLARDLMAATRPDIRGKDLKRILSEWRSYAELAAERDWDE